MLESTELTRVIVSKLCHDLAGSIGAVANAIDFLDSENQDVQKKALDLISFSSNQAINDLTFFREIYGIFKDGEDVSLDEIKRLGDLFVKYKARVFIDFRVHSLQSQIAGDFGKLILCFLPIAVSALVGDGKVQVEIAETDNGAKASISVMGKVVKVDDDMNSILLGKAHNMVASASNAHHIYTRMLAMEMDVDLSITKATGSIEYVIVRM